MFVVIVNHWCKPGKADVARARIDKNGEDMVAAKGFLYRYRMENPAEPDKVSTVTAWTEEAHYRVFKDWQRAEAAKAPSPGESPYEKVVNETFDVKKEHRA
ncbi:MAG TPA: antibiotic biosynthesis monooxygenase [Alphaproteobacteria bacterium]|nr:antibiotic biosynthesis monooxygenase [Alphaproteobacteria bacterium]